MGIDKKYNINIGGFERGARNAITDVRGVKVGHCTISDGDVQTGVTAIIPREDIFHNKLVGASYVINGFGKSVGLMQLDELGTLESPIVLTNTLSVGAALSALCGYMLERNADIGKMTGTINCVVCECNDGYLNDIRGMHVTERHVLDALENAGEDCREGAVGAGRGMTCFGYKGGVGTASRVFALDGQVYTVGVLCLSNFGRRERLRIDGARCTSATLKTEADRGSVIVIVATDLPVSARQMRRICKRTSAGLAKVGSFYGNGSGDIAVGFSTAQAVPHYSRESVLMFKALHEDAIDLAFEATADATEEAVLSSLLHAEEVVGRDGHAREALRLE